MKSLNDLQDLHQGWVVITGGAGHVAEAAAQVVLELNGQVILLDRDETELTEQKKRLSDYGDFASDSIQTIKCDLSSRENIDAAVCEITSVSNGVLTGLINNAAFVGTSELDGWAVPFAQQNMDTFDACLQVNLSAPFYLVQQCTELLKSSNSASVVNVSSIYGNVGPRMEMYEGTNMGNPAAYGASKAGLQLLTKWLASNLAPKVRVNDIVLGGIFRGQPESFLQQYNQHNMLGRMATEEDLKGAFALLISGLSQYMTGQSITVDGGWTAI